MHEKRMIKEEQLTDEIQEKERNRNKMMSRQYSNKTIKPIKLDPVKKCNTCGEIHKVIPIGARIGQAEFFGYYWECKCKSTLFKN